MIGPQLQANPCLKMGRVSSVAVDFPWLASDRINIWAWVKFFSSLKNGWIMLTMIKHLRSPWGSLILSHPL